MERWLTWCLLIDRREWGILPEDSGKVQHGLDIVFLIFIKSWTCALLSASLTFLYAHCTVRALRGECHCSEPLLSLYCGLVGLGPGYCCNLPSPFLTSKFCWKVAAPGAPGFLTWLTNATNLEHMFFRVHLKPWVPNLQAQHLPVKTASFFLNSLFASPWTIGFYNSNKEMRLWGIIARRQLSPRGLSRIFCSISEGSIKMIISK